MKTLNSFWFDFSSVLFSSSKFLTKCWSWYLELRFSFVAGVVGGLNALRSSQVCLHDSGLAFKLFDAV